MKNFIPLLSILVLVAFSSTLNAQSSDNGSITASADVVTGVSVTGATNLDFGTFTRGESSTVDIATGTPGKFTITSEGSTSAQLSFAFPAGCGEATYTYCLKDSGGGGAAGSELQLTLGATDGGWDDDDAKTNSPVNTFDPTVDQNITTPADGAFAVFVAGQVTTSPAQNHDTYTGTITLTVAYN